MSKGIFFVMNMAVRNPHNGTWEDDLKWFWRDENCEEPIGPFETEEEAYQDYKEIRGKI